MALSTAEAKDVATCYLGESSSEAPICDLDQERGSSSIVGETRCLSINPGEAHRLLRRKRSYRFPLDVIGPGETRRLSLDVISPDVILY